MHHLRTLGGLDLRNADGHAVHSILAQPKRAAVLCYLAVALPHGFHRRERICALLWPESDTEHARHSLRQALHAIRLSLGETAVLARGDDEVAISPTLLWCDAAELDRACESRQWADAVELHRGLLLDGFTVTECPDFDEWIDAQRERLRLRAEGAAWECARECVERADPGGALGWGRRALELAPTSEDALQRFMQLAAQVGRPAEAQAACARFALRLERHYDLTLSPETRALADTLRSTSPPVQVMVAPPPGATDPGIHLSRPRTYGWGGWAMLALTAVAVGWVVWSGRPDAPAYTSAALHVEIETGARLTDPMLQWRNFDLSRDGQHLVYCLAQRLVVRPLASDSPIAVPNAACDDPVPVFSPDALQVAFIKDAYLYRSPVRNGGPVAVSRAARAPLWWGEDDYIYYSRTFDLSGIWRVPSGGGTPEQVTRLRPELGERAHVLPQLLPGGKAILYTAIGMSGGSYDARVMAQRLGDDEPRVLVEGASFGRYLASGHLLYAHDDGTLIAIRFRPSRLKTVGKATVFQVGVGTATQMGGVFAAFSDNGSEAWLGRKHTSAYDFYFSDRYGNRELAIDSAAMAVMGPGTFFGRLSPEGTRIAVSGLRPGSADVWLIAGKAELERLTLDPAEDERPAWSRDGRMIAYTSTPGRILVRDVSTTAASRLLREWPRHVHVNSWSPDGAWLAINDYSPMGDMDIWAVSTRSRDSVLVAGTTANEVEPAFSPDGKWIAYAASDAGAFQVFVVSFPVPEVRRQVTTFGGSRPRWDATGTQLYYLDAGRLITRAADLSRGLQIGSPVVMFQHPDLQDFDVSANGQRFLLRIRVPDRDQRRLHVRTGVLDELRRIAR